MVLLFSSERIVRIGSDYYARVINFTDFLIQLSKVSKDSHLAMSCEVRDAESSDRSRLTPIDIDAERLLELPNLKGRYQSFFFAIGVALKVRRYLQSHRRGDEPLSLIAPGLNSITFVLSFLLPDDTRWYLFIRGDTRKTVDEVYGGSMLRSLMTSVIDLFQSRVNRLLRQQRAQVFVYGEALREKFYREFADQTHVVSPLISNDWLDEEPQIDRQISEPNRFRVLYVGRLSAEKNIHALVEACALAKDSNHAFELTIVGDGPQDRSLTKLCSQLGVEDIVDFTGRVANGPELRRLYDSHHVFCLPSKTEGTPRAIAEAVARGLPVVASDVGSIRFMFSEGAVNLLQGVESSDVLEALQVVFDNYPQASQDARKRSAEARRHTLDDNVARIQAIIADGAKEGDRV